MPEITYTSRNVCRIAALVSWPALVHQVRGWYSGVELKMGRRQGGPSRTGGRRAHPAPVFLLPFSSVPFSAKLGRDVTDEQRSRRPIFNATLWAAAGWPFFRVARSTRINSDMGTLPPVRLGPP